jgi:hypothetical protein
MDDIDEFRQQLRVQGEMIAKLAAQVEAIVKANAPPEPRKPYVREHIDFTEGMSMPRNAIEAMVGAVPDSLVRALVNDHLAKPAQHPLRGPEPKTGGTGWSEPRPLKPPPGIEQCDRLVDAADAQDRRALAQRLAKPGSE